MASAPPLPPGDWEDISPAPAPRSAPQPIIPRNPTPRNPEEVRSTIVTTNRTEALTPGDIAGQSLDNRLKQAQLESLTTGITENQNRANERERLRTTIDTASDQLLRVAQLYRESFQNSDYPISLPDAISPENEGFNSAAAALADQGFAAFRIPGQGPQSDQDALRFVQANQPTTGSSDRANEERLDALQNRLNANRALYGLPPINWRSNSPSTRMQPIGSGVPAAAVAQPGAGAPSPGGAGNPPERPTALNVDPGFDPNAPIIMNTGQRELSNGGGRAVVDEARRTSAARIQQMLLAGAEDAEILSEAERTLGGTGNIPDVLAYRRRVGQAAFRRNHSAVDPRTYTTNSAPTPGDVVSAVTDPTGSAEAGVANYLDSVSLGAPALVSGDYRTRLADLRERNPVASIAGSLVGGVTSPYGVSRTLGGQMVRGGIEGSIYAFNSTGGDPMAALEGGGLGSLIPVGARGVGAGARGAYSRLRSGGAEALPGAMAARELDIPLMPGDVGGPFTRRATSLGAQLPFSTSRVTNAYEATNDAAQAARNRVAQTVAGEGAEVLNGEAAGEAARAGALSYRKSSRDRVSRAYDQAAELAGDARITPTRALQVLDEHIAELAESPSGAPAALTSLREKLAAGDFTVGGLRRERTRLRDEFQEAGLRGSDTERRALMVVDALSEDINTQLTAAGRSEAAQAYRAADDMYRDRADLIDNVMEPIIGRDGKKDAQQVFNALETAARSHPQRLERFIRSLPNDERSSVRASLIARLGHATSGNQNAATDAFSLETFLTNYSEMKPTARRIVFGVEGTRALNQLAEVASLRRQAGRFANRSNTGTIIGGVATGGTYAGGLPAILIAAGAQYGMARLLTSPRMVRWLANMPKEPGRLRSYIGGLDAIARTEANPSLSQGILGLRETLTRAVNDNMESTGRLAASPDEGPDHE